MPIDANEPIVRPLPGDPLPGEPAVSGAAGAGFVRSLFVGEFRGDLAFPHPDGPAAARPETEEIVAAIEAFVKPLATNPADNQQGQTFELAPRIHPDPGMTGAVAPAEFDARAGFAAACGGLLRARLDRAVGRARLDRSTAELGPLKTSLALLAADLYALEATTRATVAMMERGGDDLDLETAALRRFALDALQRAVDDRVIEDLAEPIARLGRLGDGSGGALSRFIALEGGREVEKRLRATSEGFRHPGSFFRTLWSFAGRRLASSFNPPVAPVVTPLFRPAARGLTRRTAGFARAVERVLSRRGGTIADRRLDLERIAGAAVALMTSAHVLARIDAAVASGTARGAERAAAELYLRLAASRFDVAVHSLWRNHDAEIEAAGDALLRRPAESLG